MEKIKGIFKKNKNKFKFISIGVLLCLSTIMLICLSKKYVPIASRALFYSNADQLDATYCKCSNLKSSKLKGKIFDGVKVDKNDLAYSAFLFVKHKRINFIFCSASGNQLANYFKLNFRFDINFKILLNAKISYNTKFCSNCWVILV